MHSKNAQKRRFVLSRNLRRIGLISLIVGVVVSAIGLLSPFQELFIGGYVIFLAGTAITSFAIVWRWLNTRSSKREDIKTKKPSNLKFTCPRCGMQTTRRRKYCPKCGKDPCECPKKETLSIKIPYQNSIGSLQKETAFKLQDYENSVITKVTYKIFLQKENVGDLSTLSSGIRGSLSGEGNITAEIVISKTGTFSKSQIEQHIESLPVISEAVFSVDLEVEVSK